MTEQKKVITRGQIMTFSGIWVNMLALLTARMEWLSEWVALTIASAGLLLAGYGLGVSIRQMRKQRRERQR